MTDQSLNGRTVAVLATNGFEQSELEKPVDVLKAAGATSFATGHHSNLQRLLVTRFTKSEGGGGGGLAYYFSEALLAFVSQEDIIALNALGFDFRNKNDPYAAEIDKRVAELQKTPPKRFPVLRSDGSPALDRRGKPKYKIVGPERWVKYGWRQWLWWFANAERRLETKALTADDMIRNAIENWQALKHAAFIPSSKGYDGRWLTSWQAGLKLADLA